MRAVVIGGSIAGLASALFLARDGLDVTVLESDGTPLPDSMGPEEIWFRKGTPHSRQAHAFLAGAVKMLRERAPDVLAALEGNGAIRRDHTLFKPPGFDEPILGEEDIVVLNARRPMVEWTLRGAARSQAGVSFRTSAHVRALRAAITKGIPHVTGVELDGGEVVAADLVIDASGRRSSIDRWLAGIGARPTASYAEPCDQVYFGRYYKLTTSDGLPELNNVFLSVAELDWGGALVFPGDQGILQMAIGALPDDEDLVSRLRHPDAFHVYMSEIPHIQDWVACAEPITDVGVMGQLNNHVRRLVADGRPIATGLHLVGDSAAITNPQYGRGVSHALVHAAAVAGIVTRHVEDPRAQALAVDDEVTRMLEPSVQNSIRNDRLRSARWRAAVHGTEPGTEPPTEIERKVFASAGRFPDVWYAVVSSQLVLNPMRYWMHDPSLLEKIMSVEEPDRPTRADSLPSRQGLLDAMDRAIR